MIVDIHTHLAYHKIFPERFIEEVSAKLLTDNIQQNRFVLQLVKNSLKDMDGESFIKKMDESGIDKSVLLIADFGYFLGEPEFTLEQMYALHYEVKKKFPDRIFVFSGVDPRRGQAYIDLFKDSITKYSFDGLKLYPPCGFELDDSCVYPLYDICKQYNIPVLTHTGPSLNSMRTEEKYPQSILNVSREYPDINFILAHAGARCIEQTIDTIKKRDNIYCDISTFQATMTQDEMEVNFRKMMDSCPDNLLFGTDFPMFIMSTSQKQLVNSVKSLKKITDKEKEKLLCLNAQRILGIENEVLGHEY
ncbi:amidohydrolase family protein [Fulvivirga kasyanovii]|uniref:Amidohydrolase n=1 Tax=Fulvivirga kasyanovii TaxID=396812 RepID=A0ABW9RNI9_9BACT|nr:amidohydrolase family protein [Fulvivirga kasyanovii]MTI25704.1 amidohydrolase [Fulvivirga kasyanovii]